MLSSNQTGLMHHLVQKTLTIGLSLFILRDVSVAAALFWKGKSFKLCAKKLLTLSVPIKIGQWFLGDDIDFEATSRIKTLELFENATRVLFFPDDGIPCPEFHESRAGCPRDNCSFLHEETAYGCLTKLLRGAHVSIDVCVFCLTFVDLVTELIEAQQGRHVVVRVITDSEQLRVTGSQVGRLRLEGVRVRHDNTSYLMHHKFAILDGTTVLNGSFNWTRTAITGNHENLVVSKDIHLVSAFQSEFDTLWAKFDPKHQKGFVEKPTRDTWVTSDYVR